MTRIITILISLISFNIALAQSEENKAYYLTGELNLGNYIGIDVNLNYVFNEQYSFKVGYTGNIREPRSQPADYTMGLTEILLFGFGDPYDHLENYQLGFGKIYKLNDSGTIRANISLGVGYTTIKEPGNWVRIDDQFLTANYSWSYHKYNTISLIINPKIEFPVTRFFGLTASPMLQVNKGSTYIGIGFGTMIGLLRNKENTQQ